MQKERRASGTPPPHAAALLDEPAEPLGGSVPRQTRDGLRARIAERGAQVRRLTRHAPAGRASACASPARRRARRRPVSPGAQAGRCRTSAAAGGGLDGGEPESLGQRREHDGRRAAYRQASASSETKPGSRTRSPRPSVGDPLPDAGSPTKGTNRRRAIAGDDETRCGRPAPHRRRAASRGPCAG